MTSVVTVACQRSQVDADIGAKAVDPRIILRSRLTHGIGDSPLDDSLLNDSAYAALVVAAALGVPERQLISHAEEPDSGRIRVRRLLDRHLLIRDGQLLRPPLPIITGERAARYHALVRRSAKEVMLGIEQPLDSLLQELGQRGWSEWSYHFLWSQILDSQFAWARMIEGNLVPPLTDVLSWVVYPTHPWMTGTNYVPEEPSEFFMAITWTPRAASLARIYDDWRPIYRSGLAGTPVSDSAAAQLGRLHLLADDGTVELPVVRADDPLYGQLDSLSARLLALIDANIPRAELQAVTRLEARRVFVMAYHDIGWEILRRAVESGRLSRPPGLTSAGTGDMRGIAALIAAYPPFLQLFEEQ